MNQVVGCNASHSVQSLITRIWPLCLALWDASIAFFHATIDEEVFVRHQGRDDLETRQSHEKSTSRKFDLAVAGAREDGGRETSYDGH